MEQVEISLKLVQFRQSEVAGRTRGEYERGTTLFFMFIDSLCLLATSLDFLATLSGPASVFVTSNIPFVHHFSAPGFRDLQRRRPRVTFPARRVSWRGMRRFVIAARYRA